MRGERFRRREFEFIMTYLKTETDVLRLLTISGLKAKTRHKLHYTVKKMKNVQSFYIKEQGYVFSAPPCISSFFISTTSLTHPFM